MIDLHIHLLPGIDDGAGDLEEAVGMCRLAAADGCETLVATPHQRHDSWWNGDREELDRLRRQVQRRLGPRPRLLPGGEVRVDSGLVGELDRWPDCGIQPLADSNYLLLELDRHGLGPEPGSVIHELRLAGWRAIIAHPEFAPQVYDDPQKLSALAALGASFQLTAASLTGEFGRKVQSRARRMMDSGLIDFVASDAHGLQWRQPGLRRAFEEISKRWGEETARRLTHDNPAAVIENRPLETGRWVADGAG